MFPRTLKMEFSLTAVEIEKAYCAQAELVSMRC